ncbi:hypothetical protein CHLRE_08g371918v5 [Chlamydomonas reinhardtii]|uniref:Uncharacterized protein n=1 Tax=Chlamydomonas reinhardtii TaxID=3055 RepID=A0A2K3DHC2_CHLRE|nr:uncharacterized protein CHLRE_08g371918v5 [Chlamydomonas reinhardtii]PNW79916.1 hypothetical protein CHLRE_08g371918v5 [Chlamydomonas reinhardtii]
MLSLHKGQRAKKAHVVRGFRPGDRVRLLEGNSTPAAPAPAKKPAGGKRGGHRNGKLEQVHGETHFEVSRFEASK